MKPNAAGAFLVKLTSSFFFIGYLPLMPGTFGSLAAIGLFFLLRIYSWQVYFLFILLIIILGWLVSGRMEEQAGKKDPGCIVIDEVAGMLITFSFMPADLRIVFLGFLFFRILDTLKPYPAGRLQHLSGATGVMVDDLIAGVYANILLQAVLKLASFKTV